MLFLLCSLIWLLLPCSRATPFCWLFDGSRFQHSLDTPSGQQPAEGATFFSFLYSESLELLFVRVVWYHGAGLVTCCITCWPCTTLYHVPPCCCALRAARWPVPPCCCVLRAACWPVPDTTLSSAQLSPVDLPARTLLNILMCVYQAGCIYREAWARHALK